ncbi:hypothetical protein Sste5346_004978 [Sporothrix stenoceras]|uniref:Zn(2)-C6 fungal-type domain-containing protein n=1 Tax=Sporothrix stenoceras TaxID=5173 RepID=A0ABR3Z5H0_9PEZI
MIHLLGEGLLEGRPSQLQSHSQFPEQAQPPTQPTSSIQGSQPSTSPAVTGPATVSSSSSAARRTRANKACTNCARIKCKCIPRAGLGPDGYGCERCHRLGKTCEPSMTVVPSPRRARQTTSTATPRVKPSNSRSARLEAKLNDLVDLLRTSQAISEPGVAAAATAASAAVAAPDHSDDDVDAEGEADADGDDDDDTSPQSAATGGAVSGAASTAPTTLPDADPDTDVDIGFDGPDSTENNNNNPEEDELRPHEREACLRRFTEDMLPLAPFLYIPPDVTARRLQRMYPFLWRCIKAAACIHPAHRVRAAAQARAAIIRQVVSRGERSMDVLLGMLTFVTWVHLSTKDRFHRNFATMVAQMAVCVAWDLGLTMPPLLEPASTAGERFVPVVQIPGIPASMWKAQRTMEERRAVLGVYLVTSVTSQMFRSADGLRWSPYLDQCLAQLSQQSTIPQDATLVRHVKMQLLINQVRYASTNGAGGGGGAGGGHVSTGGGGSMYRSFGSGPTNLPSPYMDSLRQQLDEIVGVVDGQSPAFENFTTHNLYHFAMLAIHESALARQPPPPNPAAGTTASAWVLPDLRRFEIYQRCLTSVQAWLERLFAWPLPCYVCLPSGTYLQMFYVIVCLHKLTTLRDPAWNVEAVRGVVDLFPTIDRILGMCEELRVMLAQANQTGAAGPPSSAGAAGVNHSSNGTPASGGSASASGSIIEQDEHDPILVAIRKFSTLKIIWQNEMLAQDREREEEAAAAAARSAAVSHTATYGGTASVPSSGPILMNGAPPVPTFEAPPPIDFFSGYSLDVLSYFHAVPDAMTDVTWP